MASNDAVEIWRNILTKQPEIFTASCHTGGGVKFLFLLSGFSRHTERKEERGKGIR